MSTLILTAAQQIGPSLVRTAGQAALSFASQTVARAFDNRQFEGPRLDSFHVQTSRDGAPMARVYGRTRLAGQVIWASRLRETATEEQAGGKGGGPTVRNYSYSISFAVGLCEGEIASVDRLWANGAPLQTAGVAMRVYKGSETQLPDPIITAIDGLEAPAFRGTAYVVFEDFPLDGFGARLPQINAEVLRLPPTIDDRPRLEDRIRGVNLLPSSGEFAYATDIVEDVVMPGSARPINMNNLSGQADILLALDHLEAQLPACKHVSLIISWFGTDLRCGSCEIRPGVESDRRQIQTLTEVEDWSVGPDERADAHIVSRDGLNRPYYGGTPSDASIIQAIKALKSRGYSVSIYPFILMDIPPENDLHDPYGRTMQPAFPWRGRITCDPAPNQPVSVDGSASAEAQVAAFFGYASASDFGVNDGRITYSGEDDYGFRRFILHYAALAARAGGVDRFIIGSEMRGMTTVRGTNRSYPAVSQMVDLAAEVKTLVGPQTALSYAADWSEYFGHHPQDGSSDVSFHLDPLWASPDIDAVAIDAYFPLSDWRNNTDHLDAGLAEGIHDPAYLSANMEGGEGYDWYYASDADREGQIRTPISDGAAGKPWVFRYKDIRNWWRSEHFNRVGGVELSTATAWTPMSKPIWFTEIGCPAVNKGANQPNVFFDPKSAESTLPYYSDGSRDDLIQRRYIEAFLAYWHAESGNNPTSSVYGGPMVDLDAAYIWCWDARPFPDFPARETVWSDGPNWALGHWLTGRTGLIPLADVVHDLAFKSGAMSIDVSRVNGLVQGYQLDRPMTARAALTPLSLIYGFDLSETAEGLRFISHGSEARLTIDMANIVGSDASTVGRVREDSEAQLRDVRLHFIDATRDYQLGSVSARDQAAETVRVMDVNAPIVTDHGFGRYVTERLLGAAISANQTLQFSVSDARLDLEVGDVITVAGQDSLWRVESLDGLNTRDVSARRFIDAPVQSLRGAEPGTLSDPVWVPLPALTVLDIPDIAGQGDRSGPWVGVYARPFSPALIRSNVTDAVEAQSAAHMGTLISDLARGPVGRWDYAHHFNVTLSGLALASLSEVDLLRGGNRFAVETETGWEILQGRDFALISPDQYRVSTLLRGLAGSDADMVDRIPAGARCVWLGHGLTDIPVPDDLIGESVSFSAVSGQRETAPFSLSYQGRHLRPLSPVHGRIHRTADALRLTWIRRSRVGGDNWAALDIPLGETREFYRVRFVDNETLIAEFETDTPEFNLNGNDLMTIAAADSVRIAQGSERVGYGPDLHIDLT